MLGRRGFATRRLMCYGASVLAVLIVASPALAGARQYRGRTADNGDIDIELVQRADDPQLRFNRIGIATPNRGWECNAGYSDPTDAVFQSGTDAIPSTSARRW